MSSDVPLVRLDKLRVLGLVEGKWCCEQVESTMRKLKGSDHHAGGSMTKEDPAALGLAQKATSTHRSPPNTPQSELLSRAMSGLS